MKSSNIRNSFINGYLVVANLLNTIEIQKLVVPELVASGTDVVLDCQYPVTDDFITVRWLFNGNDAPVYQWTPQTTPLVAGVLQGRLDLTYKASPNIFGTAEYDLNTFKKISSAERRALRIPQIDTRLSGEYTCVVIKNGIESRQSKIMLVYSPEAEFKLQVKRHDKLPLTWFATCLVQGVYPQPELTVEYNNKPITQQLQRVWRFSDDVLYDAEATVHVTNIKCGNPEIICRLNLPQADYTAIKKTILPLDKMCNDAWRPKSIKLIVTASFLYLVTNR